MIAIAEMALASGFDKVAESEADLDFQEIASSGRFGA